MQELTFGGATCVQLAIAADDRKFIAHDAFQLLLSSVWNGDMHEDNGLARVSLS